MILDAAERTPPNAIESMPLVVDLDGTLVRSDMLVESAFARLANKPSSIFAMLLALLGGKANLKHHLACDFDVDAASLPYDEAVLAEVRAASRAGRPVYLASASNERIVSEIADHLDLTGWFASDAASNLSGETKARRLTEVFGKGGFSYIGNGSADLPVWASAAKSVCVRVPGHVARRVANIDPDVTFLPASSPTLETWARLFRVQQYAKNSLLFVAVLTAHAFTLDAITHAIVAAVAFSLCASGVYILNDLVDLRADRAHPTKRFRPLASGALPIGQAVMAIPPLLIVSFALALAVSLAFAAVLLAYFALTSAYTFYLKRKVLIDVIVLSTLYTLRVVAGAIAIGFMISEWLLGFSTFIFTALALVKRYVELTGRAGTQRTSLTNRGYQVGDASVVLALAAAAGFNAVTVFALYVSSDAVVQLYRHPRVLWLICPLLMYWIGRMLIGAHRGKVDDDPIVFALKDKVSIVTVALMALLVLAANW